MNRLLLDTHAFLWFLFDDPRLSPRAARTIEDARISKVLSVASLWEIVIKSQLGKLSLGMALADFFDRYITGRELVLMDIELSHLLVYETLPLAHRDPFDRLIVAQARAANIPLCSGDKVFSKYEVELIW